MNKLDIIKYNRILKELDNKSPLSIGNGDLALTFDITGSQSLSSIYKDIPLSTISNKLWFNKSGLKDIKLEKIKDKFYMTSSKGQEEDYEELRRYPHKFNLFQILLLDNEELINSNQVKNVYQELDLYTGILSSKFTYKDELVKTVSTVSQENDELHYVLEGGLNLELKFTYPSYNKEGFIDSIIPLVSEEDGYIYVNYNNDNKIKLKIKSNAFYVIENNIIKFERTPRLEFNLTLDEFKEYQDLSSFWAKDTDKLTGIENVDERMVLSKYLLKINSTGIYPPSESGLTFNNWYSKFHLEMHLIHDLWLIRSGHVDLFMKSLDYYKSIKELAKSRASLNGYSGLRFPKMTSPLGIDSPSNIGPLLIWQAPHILYALQEIYKYTNDVSLIKPYQDLIEGITDFLISFLSIKDDKVEILDPNLECSESIPLEKCINPMFEMEYFRETLKRQEELDLVIFEKIRYNYNEITSKMVMPKISNGIYLRTHGIIDSNDIYPDHPTEVFSYSFFNSSIIDDKIMNNTIDFCINKLDFNTFWGWDFPFMALCLLKLGRTEDAIKIAFCDTPNNQYLYNGHNTTPRSDLKVYLPANGAYLLFYQELSKLINSKLEVKHEK